MKVLVIEDEDKIQAFIRKGLEARDFSVTVTQNGDDGLSQAMAGQKKGVKRGAEYQPVNFRKHLIRPS